MASGSAPGGYSALVDQTSNRVAGTGYVATHDLLAVIRISGGTTYNVTVGSVTISSIPVGSMTTVPVKAGQTVTVAAAGAVAFWGETA